MGEKKQFGTRAGFIMAAVGSAIGLGNIWRFPGVAYENGGGAFFAPYLIALLTTGIGLLILEFALGNRFRGSSPLSLARLNKRFEWLGWFQVLITFVISTFYAVVLAYAARYLYASFTTAWGDDPSGYFFGEVLQISDSPTEIGSLVVGLAIPLAIIWGITLYVMTRGIQNGIERFNTIMIPVLVVLFSLIVVRALTLPGALVGLDAFFKPNWESVTDPSVWIAAYGQIFFSLSIAMGVMVTYAAYMPKRTELGNSALIAGFANSSFELLAGIGVFSALGFISQASGVPVNEVAAKGMSLAFIAFPQILNEMPGTVLFSVLFFGCLVIAGLTSLVSILEVGISGISDKFQLSRNASIAVVAGPSLVISFGYTFQNGLYMVDIVDFFTNNIGITMSAVALIVLVLYVAKQADEVIYYINAYSYFKIGAVWKGSMMVLSPVLITYMLGQTLLTTLTEGYEGYETKALVLFGWSVIAFFI
ncbi:MAG: sodium-dependent transporter, partial [Bacilli bacterium]